MLARDGYPTGVPCWIDASQPDPDAAAAFYGDLFGWELEDRTAPGSSQRYLIARLRGLDVAGIGSLPEQSPPVATWSHYVWVESADQTAAATLKSGGQVLVEPFDVGDDGRMAVLADPAGASFCVWQAARHRGAQVVNEQGAWNFSELTTPDPEGAEAFYGSVFGWTLGSIGADDGSSFWRMSGYGDHLEQRQPGMRAAMAEMGAPEGFEDAVAWLIPKSSKDAGAGNPARWSVTFAVDDADAIAERAQGLGGAVVSPPADAPWVRMTVIRDPQGAVFTASQFVPPS